MSAETKKFPYREITNDEKKGLLLMWGTPVDKEYVGEFMALGARPLIRNDWRLRSFLHTSMQQIVAKIDKEPTVTQRTFTTGALLYTGVYRHLTAAPALPVHDQAVAKLRGLNEVDLMLRSHEAVMTGAEVFCDMFKSIMPLISADMSLIDAGLMGAGIVHTLITESEAQAIAPGNMDEMFSDLKDLFTGIEGTDAA